MSNPYESTYEGFMMFRIAEDNPASSEWLIVSQNEEYEAWLLAEYDKQFG